MANKPRTRGRRTKAESASTRIRVLDRAERLFARKGYRGVSLRELAAASNVSPYTIQHHFGSKLGLYRAVLGRWDAEVRERIAAKLVVQKDLALLVEEIIDDLFDFLLDKRAWVALNARATLGEGLPRGVEAGNRTWVAFIDKELKRRSIGYRRVDIGLMLITVEGILNNHILSSLHYRQWFGHKTTQARFKRRTKTHIKQVILTVMGAVLGE